MESHRTCTIAHHVLTISAAEFLPPCLEALQRLPADPLARADMTLAVERVADADWPQGLHHEGHWYLLGRRGYCLWFDLTTAGMRLVLEAGGRVSPYWLQRDLFGLFACLTGEVLLHASAVAREGQGFVFCGVSGVGKTTMAAASIFIIVPFLIIFKSPF